MQRLSTFLAPVCLGAVLISSSLSAQCGIPLLGTPVLGAGGFPLGDEFSPAQPIGFPFVLNGTVYNDIYVSDHGVVAFTNAGVPAAPPNGTQTYTIEPAGLGTFGADVICAYWGDVVQGDGVESNIYLDNTLGTHCTITWFEHQPFGALVGDNTFSVQLTLFPDGHVEINLDNRCNNAGSGFQSETDLIIGVQLAADPVPAAPVDITTVGASVDNSWYEMWTGPGPGGTPDPTFDQADTQLYLIQTFPGWGIIPQPLPCANVSTTGTGCNGLTLASSTPPSLAGEWTIELSGVNATTESLGLPNLVFFGAGIQGTPLSPLLPTLFGAGCEAYMDASGPAFDIGPATAGVVTAVVPIPGDMSLVGASFTYQGLSWDDPLGAGPLFSVSNGETATVGLGL